MNKVYKTVWNALRHCLVVVSEATKSASQRGSTSYANGSEIGVSSPIKSVGFKHSKLALIISALFVNSLAIYQPAVAETTLNDLTIDNSQTYDELIIGVDTDKPLHFSGSGQDYTAFRLSLDDLVWEEAKIGNLEIEAGANLSVNNFVLDAGEVEYSYYFSEDKETTYTHTGKDSTFVSSSMTVSGGNSNFVNAALNGFYNQTGGTVRIQNLTTSDLKDLYYENRGQIYDSQANVTLSGGTLALGTLNSSTSVRAKGGVLQADSIALSSQTLEMSGAQLKTGLQQIASIKKVIEQAQTLLMGSNDVARSVNATAIGSHDEVNGILSQFKNNVSWKSGSFYFTGSYTQSLANTASALIKSTFGSGVNVQFERITADPTPADVTNGLTAAIANAVISENGQTAGLIFRQYAFDARNNDLIVGQSGGVTTSVGFTHLNGSHGATVTGGKTLALLGQGGSNPIATGTLTANNGTLRLGTTNTGVTVGGVVNSVQLTNNGVLNTVRGTYTVKDLSGNGTVNVDSGVLNLQSATFVGTLNNKGTLNLGADFDLYTGTNNGTMNVSTVEINDVFKNTGSANISGAWNFGTNGQYQHTAGTLTTIQDNLFENVNFSEIDPLNTITLGQSVPQDIKTTMTELFQKYVPGNVVESIAQHATFNGGKVIVTGVKLTQTMVDDLTRAFKETFFIRFPKAFPQLSALWLWA